MGKSLIVMMAGVSALKTNVGKIYLTALLCLSLASCSTRDKISYLSDDFTSTAETIKIQLDEQQDSIPVESIISGYELIQLETNSECMLGTIDQILITDQYIIVSDCHKVKQIYVFNHDGSYSHTIGKKGRGPGEYIQPTDITIKDSRLVVLDMFSHQLLYYDVTGKFLYAEKYSDKIHEIESDGAQLFAYAGDNRHNKHIKNYEFLILNTDNTVKSAEFYNPYSLNYKSGNNIKHIDGKLYFARALLPCICEYDSDRGLFAKYVLELSPNPLPIGFEKICHGDYENFMKLFRKNNSYFSDNYWETDRYLSFTLDAKGKRYVFLKDKITGSSYLNPLEIRRNRSSNCGLSNLAFWLADSYAITDNCLYSVVAPELLLFFDSDRGFESNPAILKIRLN